MCWLGDPPLTFSLRRRRCRPASTRSGAAACTRAAESKAQLNEPSILLRAEKVQVQEMVGFLTVKSSGEIQLSPSATPVGK